MVDMNDWSSDTPTRTNIEYEQEYNERMNDFYYYDYWIPFCTNYFQN